MLKLYVWDDHVLDGGWGHGVMFALAESEEQARDLLVRRDYNSHSNWYDCTIDTYLELYTQWLSGKEVSIPIQNSRHTRDKGETWQDLQKTPSVYDVPYADYCVGSA